MKPLILVAVLTATAPEIPLCTPESAFAETVCRWPMNPTLRWTEAKGMTVSPEKFYYCRLGRCSENPNDIAPTAFHPETRKKRGGEK